MGYLDFKPRYINRPLCDITRFEKHVDDKLCLIWLANKLQGVGLTKVPKIKFLIIIGGAKFRAPAVVENAYASPVECPSLHFLGMVKRI